MMVVCLREAGVMTTTVRGTLCDSARSCNVSLEQQVRRSIQRGHRSAPMSPAILVHRERQIVESNRFLREWAP